MPQQQLGNGVSVLCEGLGKVYFRGPNDHINIRILRSGSKAQYKEDTRFVGSSCCMWSVGALCLGFKVHCLMLERP